MATKPPTIYRALNHSKWWCYIVLLLYERIFRAKSQITGGDWQMMSWGSEARQTWLLHDRIVCVYVSVYIYIYFCLFIYWSIIYLNMCIHIYIYTNRYPLYTYIHIYIYIHSVLMQKKHTHLGIILCIYIAGISCARCDCLSLSQNL